jgi:hypothetical protein
MGGFHVGTLQRRQPGDYQPMGRRPFGDKIGAISLESPKLKRRTIRTLYTLLHTHFRVLTFDFWIWGGSWLLVLVLGSLLAS